MSFCSFFVRSALFRLAALGTVASVAVGCGTGVTDDVPPQVRNTGAYPNLNIPMRAQTTQFSPQEQASRTAGLQAAKARQQAQIGAPAPKASDAATLKRLGATHGDEALREIQR